MICLLIRSVITIGFLYEVLMLNNIPGSNTPLLLKKDSIGVYFDKKKYIKSPLPQYKDIKSLLPSPIYDENPLYTSICIIKHGK